MKINLQTKDEEKRQLGVMIYSSDYEYLQAKASTEGIKLTMLVRSILNDYMDNNKKQETKNVIK